MGYASEADQTMNIHGSRGPARASDALAQGAVRGMIASLKDSDPGVRGAAATSLGRLGPSARLAVPVLARLLSDRDVSVHSPRGAAADALGKIGGAARGVTPTLARMLGDPLFGDRAAEALRQIGASRRGIVSRLQRMLRSPTSYLRQRAAVALGGVGPTAIPMLAQALRDPEHLVRTHAAKSLAMIGPSAARALIEALGEDEGAEVREEAALALGELTTEPAVLLALRTSLLHDTSPSVRAAAARALTGSPTIAQSCADVLAEALEKESHWHPATAIAEALGEIEPSQKTVSALASALSLESDATFARLAAARALEGIGSPARPSCGDLTRTLQDKSWAVRIAAARALASVGGEARTAIEVLVKALALEGKQTLEREDAVQAFGRLGPGREEATPILIEILRRGPHLPLNRAAAASALAYMPPTDTVVSALEESLEDDEELVRERAARSLGALGPAARRSVPSLARHLSRDYPAVQEAAAWALGKIGPEAEDAIPALLEAHRTGAGREWNLGEIATVALGGVWPAARHEVVATLSAALRGHLCTAAAEALSRIGAREEGVVSALIAAMEHWGNVNSPTAVDALAMIGDDAVPSLLEALVSGSPGTRAPAAEALGKIGSATDDVIRALSRSLTDDNSFVRQESATALGSCLVRRVPQSQACACLPSGGVRCRKPWKQRRPQEGAE
jgi:HEAT repeat protein